MKEEMNWDDWLDRMLSAINETALNLDTYIKIVTSAFQIAMVGMEVEEMLEVKRT